MALNPTDYMTTIKVLNTQLTKTQDEIDATKQTAIATNRTVKSLDATVNGTIELDPMGQPIPLRDKSGETIYDDYGEPILQRKGDGIVVTKLKVDDLEANAITTEKLESGTAKIKDAYIESINGSKIKDGTVIARALSNEAIQTLSGTHVYYQAEPPTGGNYVEGDTWYKTVIADTDTDKNVLHIWNGTTWEASDFDGRIIRANTITSQEINTNSLATNNAFVGELETAFTRVGSADGKHIDLADDGISFYDEELKDVAEIGIKTRLGESNGARIEFSPYSQVMYGITGKELFSVAPEWGTGFGMITNIAQVREDTYWTRHVYSPNASHEFEKYTSVSFKIGNTTVPSSAYTTTQNGNGLIVEFDPPYFVSGGSTVETTIGTRTVNRYLLKHTGDAEISGNLTVTGKVKGIHPVGSVIHLGEKCYTEGTGTETTCSTASDYGTLKTPTSFGYEGTWKLIDKRYKRLANSDVSKLFTINSTNVTSINELQYERSDHSHFIACQVVNKVALTDSTTQIATVKFDYMGLASLHNTIRFTGGNDSCNAVVLYELTTGKVINSYDAITRATSIPSSTGTNSYFSLMFNVNLSQMLDSHCEEFVWERIE